MTDKPRDDEADLNHDYMMEWVDDVTSGVVTLQAVPARWRFDKTFQDTLAQKLGLGPTVLQYVQMKALEDVLLKRLGQQGEKSCTCQVSANRVDNVTNQV